MSLWGEIKNMIKLMKSDNKYFVQLIDEAFT